MNTPGRATGAVVEARAVCGYGNILFFGLQVDLQEHALGKVHQATHFLILIKIAWE